MDRRMRPRLISGVLIAISFGLASAADEDATTSRLADLAIAQREYVDKAPAFSPAAREEAHALVAEMRSQVAAMTDAQFVLALARGVNGDYEGEIEALNRVIELRPSDDSAHLSLGVAQGLNGNTDPAKTELLSVGAGPRKGDALAALGFVLAMQGNATQAERRLNEAIASDVLNVRAEANVLLGRMKLVEGTFPEAQAYLAASGVLSGLSVVECKWLLGLDSDFRFENVSMQAKRRMKRATC